ncbi:MAG: nucleotidyltransferase domain-containing protein [Chloroflexota bacterium]|nr:nucleotidyltransferase domain-containing protein [Chloroflexota bacterium]MDE2960011.1 nucleotidyltransferase domain-containing protein [Chloroflexota bacterium]
MIVPLSQVDIAPQHLEIVTDILRRHLPDREVWAYGSRVTGRSWRYSDLDLVALGDLPIGAMLMDDLLNEMSETLLPYIVELKDWQRIPPHWRDEILRCYAVIHSPERAEAVDEAHALRGIERKGDPDAMRFNRPS